MEARKYQRRDGYLKSTFEAHGVIAIDVRSFSLLDPVLTAAASRIAQIGGVYKYLPACDWRETQSEILTLREPIGDSITWETSDKYVEAAGVEVRYIDEETETETSLPHIFDIWSGGKRSGGIEPLAFGMSKCPAQSARLAHIFLKSNAATDILTATFPQYEVDRVEVGDAVSIRFRDFEFMNGIYIVNATTQIPIRMQEGDGLALRTELVLEKYQPGTFDFSESDEV